MPSIFQTQVKSHARINNQAKMSFGGWAEGTEQYELFNGKKQIGFLLKELQK